MADEVLDVRREIAEAPVRPFHWALVTVIAIAIVFDGIDTLVPSYVIPFVKQPWGLSGADSGLLVSAGLVGFAIGALLHGPVADRFGRRPVLIAGLLLSGVFSVVTGLSANSFGLFLALRLCTGLGLGILLPLGVAYLNECLPRLVRNRLSVLGASGFSVGGILAGFFGIFVAPTLGWHSLFLLGGGTILLALIVPFVLPESPEWLVAHGRHDRAAAVLSRMNPGRAQAFRAARLTVETPASGGGWRLPLSRGFRGRTVALWYSAFLLLFAAYGITAWTPTLLIERGFAVSSGFALGATLQGVSIVGGLLGAAIADRRLGARNLMVLWCALGAVSIAGIGVAGTGWLTAVAVGATGMFVHGGLYVLYNVCAQTYPVQARGTGQGMMIGVGRWGAVLGPYLGGSLLGAVHADSVLYLALALITALAIIGLAAVRTNVTAGRSAPARVAEQA
ncbi:MFS transporter [Amycolatopsis acidicola]|uniref:MFS transporter n=1 Tax=Amycolatopsis acidicola TaxID=2596893 RepID=A0A5N0VH40_9PSEU|nr:MFS transporter [Amycolatopsis acidicola]KAA9164460.1 MFS transporter [Amycolatopsis acidicola]